MPVKIRLLFYLTGLLFSGSAGWADNLKPLTDPHYNALGFFDIHVCNWPERPNFFKVLFSTRHYEQIKTMAIYGPDKQALLTLDMSRFMYIKATNKGQKDKHVYMRDIDMPEDFDSGWYEIKITTRDGRVFNARDYVINSRIDRARAITPVNDSTVSLPVTLSWKPVPGAQFYKVFVRDEWSGQLVFTSELLTEPKLTLPEKKLMAGGYYSWKVHARDTNEHLLLGDFHMGSLSRPVFFYIEE